MYGGMDEEGFQAQGQYGLARNDPNGAPQPSAAQIPPQMPGQGPQGDQGPQQPQGQEWQGGGGLYGGIWGAMDQGQQNQYLGLQAQDQNLQPMAGGGEQSNVGRRQAMWSVLNQDNTYSNEPEDWGNFGGSNWSGYGG